MNTDIEKLLRNARKFTPPTGLRERLIGQIPQGGTEVVSKKVTTRPASGGWLRRWWPVIAPATVSVACAMVLTVQQAEIRELKASNQALSQAAAAQLNGAQGNDAVNTVAADSSADVQREIERLRTLATQLKGEIGQLQQLKTENTALRAEAARPPELALTPQEAEELAKAREKAMSIACINNLKQFGLAVRIWAMDNGDTNPPSILSMSNELSTPKVLVCQADTTRQTANDWASFTMANCSYEYLAPNEKTDTDPQRVLTRCPIHGHIGLADGSVQGFVAKNHPDWLVERNGKLYLQSPGSGAAQSTPNGNTVTLFGGPGAVWNSLFITNHASLPLQCSACHSGQPGAASAGLTVPTTSELSRGASLTGVQMQQLKIFWEQHGHSYAPVESQPGSRTGEMTPEQLKVFQERYGLVPGDGSAPQQQP